MQYLEFVWPATSCGQASIEAVSDNEVSPTQASLSACTIRHAEAASPDSGRFWQFVKRQKTQKLSREQTLMRKKSSERQLITPPPPMDYYEIRLITACHIIFDSLEQNNLQIYVLKDIKTKTKISYIMYTNCALNTIV